MRGARCRAVGTRVDSWPSALRAGCRGNSRPSHVHPPGADLAAGSSPRETWTRSDYQFRLDELIVGLRLRSCVTIAVVSPKGGVGKSTITALLGSLFAFLRRDRVVAVETNPDWGSLGRRLVPDHPIFIDDLLAGAAERRAAFTNESGRTARARTRRADDRARPDRP